MEYSLLTVHFLHRLDEVLRILEGHESKALGFVRPFVSHYFSLLEAGILAEYSHQHLIGDVVSQIAAEYPEIVCAR